MIPPDLASRIQVAIDTLDPAAITEHVEKAVNRQGEAVVVNWVVDPTQIQFYQSLADNAGISLEQQLKSLLDYAFSQGWFNSAAPDPFKILLDAEQWRFLQKLFGKDLPTGEDVINRMLEESGTTFEPEGEEDLVLDSLRGKG